MRIGLDFRPAVRRNSRRRGVGKYTFCMTRALVEAAADHELVLYTCRGELSGLIGSFESRDLVQVERPLRVNWILDRLLLSRTVRRDRLDIFHGNDITWPTPAAGAKVCATIHDLIPFIFWEQTIQSTPWDYRMALRVFLKRIPALDAIITDSECSRADICERTGIAPERVHVAYPGAVHDCRPVFPEQAREELVRKTGLKGPFLFYVGGTDFRKNLSFLVHFFARVRSRGYEGKLVLGGETFLWEIPEVAQIQKQIRKLDLGSAVLTPGHIPEEMLPCYYCACDFFVFPSLYEGFGLPILEAMQCGAPILAARTSSIPEVAGDSAFYFDPRELESAVSVFDTVLNDSAAVAEKRKVGLQRAGRFTWEKTARRILTIYDELIS